MSTTIYSETRQVIEWNYISKKVREDPFNEIELDVIITYEEEESWVIPAFWAGGEEWKVRFSAPKSGSYLIISKCSDTGDEQLHRVEKTLSIHVYKGDNPLYIHGALQINASKLYFEHTDGTPYFWLGDTWWMGLSKRLSWPKDFQLLTKDRVEKGFSVIQIVAGLYPDMDSFDQRGENEAGFPWEKEYTSINPSYFDMADLRIEHLVDSGLVPCILGSWGYYLFPLGIVKMKQHWRYIIARWGAYPVAWSLAGETAMPYYLSTSKEEDRKKLREGWTEIAHYIKETDPYQRLLTVHPTHIGREQITDDSIIDFDMLQTGHKGCISVKNTLRTLYNELNRKPKIPVVVSEVNYEGIRNSNYSKIQRLTFWSSILSGASGFTYGANGLWQINQRGKPFGNSPNGNNWGNTPWEDAYKLDGGKQLGLASKLLQNYDWWNFEFHPEWISKKDNNYDLNIPFSAGIPGKIRIIYYHGSKFAGKSKLFEWIFKKDNEHNLYMPFATGFTGNIRIIYYNVVKFIWHNKLFKIARFIYCYGAKFLWINKPFKILNLEPNINYNAYFWNPRNGIKHDIGFIEINKRNEWKTPVPPTFEDWIVILEARL